MNYILVCIEKPKDEIQTEQWQVWFSFLSEIGRDTKLKEAGERLLENVWKFRVPDELHISSRFLAAVQKRPLKCKTYWLAGDFQECK